MGGWLEIRTRLFPPHSPVSQPSVKALHTATTGPNFLNSLLHPRSFRSSLFKLLASPTERLWPVGCNRSYDGHCTPAVDMVTLPWFFLAESASFPLGECACTGPTYHCIGRLSVDFAEVARRYARDLQLFSDWPSRKGPSCVGSRKWSHRSTRANCDRPT